MNSHRNAHVTRPAAALNSLTSPIPMSLCKGLEPIPPACRSLQGRHRKCTNARQTVRHCPSQFRRLTGHSRRRHQTTCRCEWKLFCGVFFKHGLTLSVQLLLAHLCPDHCGRAHWTNHTTHGIESMCILAQEVCDRKDSRTQAHVHSCGATLEMSCIRMGVRCWQ